MPETNGPELVRGLRARAPALKVLCMSGYASGPGAVELDAPLLQKPFSTKEFLKAVRETLDATVTEPVGAG